MQVARQSQRFGCSMAHQGRLLKLFPQLDSLLCGSLRGLQLFAHRACLRIVVRLPLPSQRVQLRFVRLSDNANHLELTLHLS